MMLTQNSKMLKASLKTYNFDIPAGKSGTCIGAGECQKYCYALKGFYRMPNVKAKHASNLEASKQLDFIDKMSIEIKSIKDLDAIRIHSAGDFYSALYLSKWLNIAYMNKDIVFYCYTKSVPLFINTVLPDNFKVIYSKGGIYDHLIDLHELRSCSLSESYNDYTTTSDDNDSMIVFSEEPITLIKRG